MKDYKKAIPGKKNSGLNPKRSLKTFATDRVHFIITGKKQNSWVDDLDEREKLAEIQRVFH